MSDDRRAVTRRDFVRGSAGAALGVSLFGLAGADPLGREPRSARVTLVRDREVLNGAHDVDAEVLRAMLATAVMRVTGAASARDGWRALVRPGDIVGLVPTSHLNPTHGEVVAAVRAAVHEAGVAPDRIRIAQGGPENAEACTALISLPALKAHWLTGLGTVMKNYITFSGHPSRYHDENNDRLGEIWLLPHVKGKTRLVLVDALRPLCDKGPQPDPRYMWEYKGVLAGTDPVAVEAVALKILTAKREALRGEPWPLSPPPLCVVAADTRYGLGTCRLDEITIDRVGWAEDALV
ncbi:MAG TPA: DUF362 domain-containing protein [Thermoanaerobaculaceae bacterium]|nr:DUF362 domain-containing protein [Thermoanaerobaculaceae bacterium]